MLTTQTFVVYLLHRGKCCRILIAPWEMLSYTYCTVGNVVAYLLHRGKCMQYCMKHHNYKHIWGRFHEAFDTLVYVGGTIIENKTVLANKHVSSKKVDTSKTWKTS